jgi:hypothetical protein
VSHTAVERLAPECREAIEVEPGPGLGAEGCPAAPDAADRGHCRSSAAGPRSRAAGWRFCPPAAGPTLGFPTAFASSGPPQAAATVVDPGGVPRGARIEARLMDDVSARLRALGG